MLKRHNRLYMAALGALLTSGAGAVAAAFDSAEKFVVTGALKVTHIITEQVCDFDTLDQLEDYLAAVADRHHWFRHDQPAAGAAQDATSTQLAQDPATQVDTAGEQYAALSGTPAPIVNIDLEQLRAGTAPADAITIEAAPAASATDTSAPAVADTAAPEAPEAPAASEQPATATDTAA